MEEKEKKRNIKLISNSIMKNLDAIQNTCDKTAKAFKKDEITLTFLKLVIEKAKPKLVGDEVTDGLIVECNKTLDVLYKICEERSKMIHPNNTSINLTSLKFFINHVKKTYKLALRDV